MPELPEVEVVRRGLAQWVEGRTIETVEVRHSRAVRAHLPGAKDFSARLLGRTIAKVNRRGKYMWLTLDDEQAVVVHLGMSGQALVQPLDAEPEKHLRIRFTFTDRQSSMHFVDQRTFGGMRVDELVDTDHAEKVPVSVAHIARDPLDENFEPDLFVKKLRTKNTEVKRALLDQTLMSGVGNIYADEALWRAQIHGATDASTLKVAKAQELLRHATEVMTEALAQGGTSFDSLYVNVNGESGYFSRGLNAYGRENEPCPRCGNLIIREVFMNRSSFSCPKCQPRRKSTLTR